MNNVTVTRVIQTKSFTFALLRPAKRPELPLIAALTTEPAKVGADTFDDKGALLRALSPDETATVDALGDDDAADFLAELIVTHYDRVVTAARTPAPTPIARTSLTGEVKAALETRLTQALAVNAEVAAVAEVADVAAEVTKV